MKRISIILLSSLLIESASAVEISDNLTLEPSFRWRYQDVQNDILGDAEANTLKLRLSADWQVHNNISLFAQADHVHAFDEDSYNSVTVQRNTSPIPDPAGTELNQFYLNYNSDANWQVTLGRQAILLDNERHISPVEFWQNDQTFDALRFQYQDNINWSLNYAYINKVHRITGDDAKSILSSEDERFMRDPIRPVDELGNHQHQTHLFNLQYQYSRSLSLTAFAYLLDNQTQLNASSNTLGVRLNGDSKPKSIKYSYTLEWAQQQDAADSPWNYNANYKMFEVGAQYKSHQLLLSYEAFGSDNNFGFATTLGNNHKLQGWADIFSGYQAISGLEDIYLTYRGRAGKLRWRAIAHQFSDNNGRDIGDELDIEIAYRYSREWEFKAVGAFYFVDQGAPTLPSSLTDVTTWFVSVAYNL